MKDLTQVCEAVSTLKARYDKLGLVLELSPYELDATTRDNPNDCEAALNEVMKKWLKNGLRTWKQLVIAVDNPSGGNNHKLAKSIAERHPQGK